MAQFIASINTAPANTTNITLADFSALPWEIGDIGLIVHAANDNHVGYSDLAGYSILGGFVNAGTGSPDRSCYLLGKVLGGGEDTTPTLAAVTTTQAATFMVWRNLELTEIGTATQEEAGGEGDATPAITVEQDLAVVFSINHRTHNVDGPWTEPSGYTLVGSGILGTNLALGVAYKFRDAGVETPGAWDYNPTDPNESRSLITTALQGLPDPVASGFTGWGIAI